MNLIHKQKKVTKITHRAKIRSNIWLVKVHHVLQCAAVDRQLKAVRKAHKQSLAEKYQLTLSNWSGCHSQRWGCCCC